jgi:ATPase subunit of ABC transporter with duplicated ATPase domains
VNTVIEASGLGERYGRRWALADCTLAVPAGRVTGLVGPNGAGKTTLLQLAAGLLEPDSGTIAVLGGHPGSTPAQLARVGFAPRTPGRPHLTAGAGLADAARRSICATPERAREAAASPRNRIRRGHVLEPREHAARRHRWNYRAGTEQARHRACLAGRGAAGSCGFRRVAWRFLLGD